MTAIALPDRRAPEVAARRRWLARAPLAVGFAASGIWMIVSADRVRGLEATGAAILTRLSTGSETASYPDRAVFYWNLFTERAHGLTVTPECSVAFTVGPLLIVIAAVAYMGRLRPTRIVAAALVAVATIAAINVVRLATIAWSISRFGPRAGFWWSHAVVGSLLTIGGGAVGVALAVRIGFAGHQGDRPGSGPSPGVAAAPLTPSDPTLTPTKESRSQP